MLYLFLVISQRRVVIWYPYFSQCCSTDPIAPVLVKNIGKKLTVIKPKPSKTKWILSDKIYVADI